MQKDMHYYCTYVMARAAGLNRNVSEIIATASQFVDDNASKNNILFKDAGRVDAEATAHHAVDVNNIKPDDQRQVWVPFHFLPGTRGETFADRLVCVKNSDPAKEMVKHHLTYSRSEFFLELMGITAHVFADTFSHYGFSGIGSPENEIINDSFELGDLSRQTKEYIDKKRKSFLKKFGDTLQSFFAEELSGALGHGAALTFPDRPYLVWSFVYEKTKTRCPVRNNPETYREYCSEIYKIFKKVGRLRPELRDQSSEIKFIKIRGKLLDILATQATKKDRIEIWKRSVMDGKLLGGNPEEIPEYQDWNSAFGKMNNKADSRIALKSPVFRYFQAAALHRIFVLRQLLPMHGLVVA